MKLWKKLMKIKIIDRLKSNVMSIAGRSTLYEYALHEAQQVNSHLKCSKYVIWNDHSNKIEYAECVFKSNEDFKWRVASSTFSLSSLCVDIHVGNTIRTSINIRFIRFYDWDKSMMQLTIHPGHAGASFQRYYHCNEVVLTS